MVKILTLIVALLIPSVAVSQEECIETQPMVGCQLVLDYTDELRFCTDRNTVEGSLESCTFSVNNDSAIILPASGPDEFFEISAEGIGAGHTVESFCIGRNAMLSEVRVDEFCHYKNPDITGDGIANISDFLEFVKCFVNNRDKCDLDYSGFFGIDDINIFISKYNTVINKTEVDDD